MSYINMFNGDIQENPLTVSIYNTNDSSDSATPSPPVGDAFVFSLPNNQYVITSRNNYVVAITYV